MQTLEKHTLTQRQVQQYHDQGYIHIPSVFDQEQLQRIHGDLDRMLQTDDHHRPGRGWMMELANKSQLAEEICQDERILDLLSPLISPGIALHSSKLVTKEPHDDAQCHWHQDEMYYVKHGESACRISAYVALQDISPEMGCLQVVPGSHKRGLKQSQRRTDGTCKLTFAEPVDLTNAIHLPMQAGDVLLFSAWTHHGSAGNATSNRRRAFIISYQEATGHGGNPNQWKILRAA